MTSIFDEGMEDPFSSIKDDKKSVTKTLKESKQDHSRSDVDESIVAQHHTLGRNRNQSASGSHIHDGKESALNGEDLGLAISGSKGGNAALASLITMLGNIIDFTDNTT